MVVTAKHISAHTRRRGTVRSRRALVLLLALAPTLASAQGAGTQGPDAVVATTSNAFEVPAWLFPIPPPAAVPGPTTAPEPVQVPGSRMSYAHAQLANLFAVPDWFPEAHPRMPEIVAQGRQPTLYACGYCHLATGAGRPENATVAGLPVAYIVEQLKGFANGQRNCAWTGSPYKPTVLMTQVARAATEAEVLAAATYFSALVLAGPRAEVVETDRVPRTRPSAWLYVTTGDGDELLGDRIIEVPRDFELHERRDPHADYVAYVPPGSVERGRAIATSGAGAVPACTSCHGADLRGVALIPPIAGRSPTYLLRQLVAFRTGARDTPAGAPMKPVVAGLTLQDMIAVASYAAAQRP